MKYKVLAGPDIESLHNVKISKSPNRLRENPIEFSNSIEAMEYLENLIQVYGWKEIVERPDFFTLIMRGNSGLTHCWRLKIEGP